MLYCFIQFPSATVWFAFLPTCRLVSIDHYLLCNVHPLVTAALCFMACWVTEWFSSHCCNVAEKPFTDFRSRMLSSSVIQKMQGEVGGGCWKCEEGWPQKQGSQKLLWASCKMLFIEYVRAMCMRDRWVSPCGQLVMHLYSGMCMN